MRLTLADMKAGKDEVAERRNLEESKIIGRERRWNQRKLLEGIESLIQRDIGIKPLNGYNKLEQCQATLSRCLEN